MEQEANWMTSDIFPGGSNISTGNPAHEGDSLKMGVPPQKGDCPPSRGFFSLCITIYRRKNQNCKQATMMSMKVHVFSLHAPIYRHFYPCVGKINKFKHFDVERPVKVCAPTGLSRAPPPKLSGELSSQALYEKGEKIRGFPYETPTMPVVYRRSSRCFNGKKNLVRKCKHTLILCDYTKIDIRLSEEI